MNTNLLLTSGKKRPEDEKYGYCLVRIREDSPVRRIEHGGAEEDDEQQRYGNLGEEGGSVSDTHQRLAPNNSSYIFLSCLLYAENERVSALFFASKLIAEHFLGLLKRAISAFEIDSASPGSQM